MIARRLLGAVGLALLLCVPAKAGDFRLMMLHESWCDWCQKWEEEIGVVYDKTVEGRRAPLIRASIHADLPDGVSLSRRAHFTPTFVLLDDGAEVGRIEGYPGEDFFYGLLNRLLDSNDVPKPAQESPANAS